jgi:hypothetical protein
VSYGISQTTVLRLGKRKRKKKTKRHSHEARHCHFTSLLAHNNPHATAETQGEKNKEEEKAI